MIIAAKYLFTYTYVLDWFLLTILWPWCWYFYRHLPSVQFNQIAHKLSSVRRQIATCAWPLIHRLAGQLLIASSVWSTRLNTCLEMMGRYTQVCTDLFMSAILSIAFCFSYCVTCLNLDWTFFICSDTKEDQQAEGPLQRLAGALTLEPVDSLEKCNLLTLFKPKPICSCSFFVHVCNVHSHPLTYCFPPRVSGCLFIDKR